MILLGLLLLRASCFEAAPVPVAVHVTFSASHFPNACVCVFVSIVSRQSLARDAGVVLTAF